MHSSRSEPPRVLITGATGFIGYEVARQAAQAGWRPRLLVRRPLRAAVLARFDAEIVQGDLTSPPSLERAVSGTDAVIHLAARAVFEEYSLVRPTIVDGSVALAEAAAAAGVSRFVYASSLLVYDSQSEPIDETTPAKPRSDYGRAKVEAEEALAAIASRHGFGLACLRLPHVYGARDLMFEQVRRGRVVFPGDGENLYAHLHVEDAARLLLALATGSWTGVSPVADDAPATWNQFFARIEELYPRFRRVGVPEWLATLGMHLLTPLRRLQKRPSLYTPEAVESWNLELPVRPGLLWDELGLEPRYPTIQQGIPAALDDCVAFMWRHPLADRAA